MSMLKQSTEFLLTMKDASNRNFIRDGYSKIPSQHACPLSIYHIICLNRKHCFIKPFSKLNYIRPLNNKLIDLYSKRKKGFKDLCKLKPNQCWPNPMQEHLFACHKKNL